MMEHDRLHLLQRRDVAGETDRVAKHATGWIRRCRPVCVPVYKGGK